jgi:hypothetical protein
MKLPLVFVCSLTAAAIGCTGHASAAQRLTSSQSIPQNYRAYDVREADRAEAYESFALAPGTSAFSSAGRVNTCNTIRPWKDESFNSANPSWLCQ